MLLSVCVVFFLQGIVMGVVMALCAVGRSVSPLWRELLCPSSTSVVLLLLCICHFGATVSFIAPSSEVLL